MRCYDAVATPGATLYIESAVAERNGEGGGSRYTHTHTHTNTHKNTFTHILTHTHRLGQACS